MNFFKRNDSFFMQSFLKDVPIKNKTFFDYKK